MTRQYDVYRRPNGTLVVDVQHTVLEDLKTRVVVPLIPKSNSAPDSRSLNPTVSFDGKDYFIGTQFIATATLAELGTNTGDITHKRDDIIRALDLLFTGF
jgi:toxin CcdB